jgi:protein sidekick
MPIGRPKPQYKWLKDGASISDFKDDEILKINDAKKSDSGFYQCLARNDAGTIFGNKSEIVVACKMSA